MADFRIECLKDLERIDHLKKSNRARDGNYIREVNKLRDSFRSRVIRLTKNSNDDSEARKLELLHREALEYCEKENLLFISERRKYAGKRQQAEGETFFTLRRRIAEELSRVEIVEGGMMRISENIAQAGTLFEKYSSEINKARKLVGRIIKKSEEDGRFLSFAWGFFCIVCLYIIVKRIGLLKLLSLMTRILSWIIRLTIRGGSFGWLSVSQFLSQSSHTTKFSSRESVIHQEFVPVMTAHPHHLPYIPTETVRDDASIDPISVQLWQPLSTENLQRVHSPSMPIKTDEEISPGTRASPEDALHIFAEESALKHPTTLLMHEYATSTNAATFNNEEENHGEVFTSTQGSETENVDPEKVFPLMVGEPVDESPDYETLNRSMIVIDNIYTAKNNSPRESGEL